jgi:hypothetical protein
VEQRPQLDRTYLPTPATTVEMYLNAILDIVVQIRDQQAEQRPKLPPAPVGQIALREPAPPHGSAQRDLATRKRGRQ